MAIFTATQFDCDNPWTETTDKDGWANDLFAIVYTSTSSVFLLPTQR